MWLVNGAKAKKEMLLQVATKYFHHGEKGFDETSAEKRFLHMTNGYNTRQ